MAHGEPQIGLLIIGDEILSGRRQDKHFPFALTFCKKRAIQISWVQYLPDDEGMIVDSLRMAFARTEVVFCFGGIGITPDDKTRHAAAHASGQPFLLHEAALRELSTRFGPTLDAQKKEFARLPANADIILNPYSRVPGFRVENINFLPGFPEMAHPMFEQTIDLHYHHLCDASSYTEKAMKIFDARESDLVSLMTQLESTFDITIFSLPVLEHPPYIEFGVKGAAEQVLLAFTQAHQELTQRRYVIEIL